MLLLGLGMGLSNRWRAWGVVMLSVGTAGAVMSCLGLALLSWLLNITSLVAETWLLFAAAGFGWSALAAGGVLMLLGWLRVPNRWGDRKRNANA